MVKIGVLISGGGTNLQAIIDACDAGHIEGEVVAVVSNQAEAFGLLRADQHDIPHCVSKDDQTTINFLDQQGCQMVVLAGYLKAVSLDLIDAYPNRIINVHPSLIPSFSGKGFYGLHVHRAALDRGVKVSGATVHLVTKGLDEGPILFQEAVRVEKGDTAEDLQARILPIEHQLIVKGVNWVIDQEVKERK